MWDKFTLPAGVATPSVSQHACPTNPRLSCTRVQTSLVRALSTVLSTAALDKHPQSRERGITLDLGFSAFSVPPPPSLAASYSAVQFTLVDCPGHASLIRTVIGGAQIIDMMLLVVDATKGMQTQTAECVVIG